MEERSTVDGVMVLMVIEAARLDVEAVTVLVFGKEVIISMLRVPLEASCITVCFVFPEVMVIVTGLVVASIETEATGVSDPLVELRK